jgi:DNA repair exonuclease SbcCD nuclease subunit
MKIFGIGDLHLKISDIESAKTFFKWVIKELQQSPCDLVVFFGDIYEVKSILRAEAQNVFYDFLRTLRDEIKVRICIIVGNHDFTNLQCVEHAFSGLQSLRSEGIFVIDEATGIPSGDQNIFMVPYHHSPEAFLECVNDLPIKKGSLLLCHQAFMGAVYNEQIGITDEKGCDQKSINPDITHIVSGHIHAHQTIGRVTYVGTPYPHSFSEANAQKSAIRIEQVEGGWRYMLLSTNNIGLPWYYSVNTDVARLKENSKKIKYSVNDYVRFVIVDTETECKKITKPYLAQLADANEIAHAKEFFLKYSPTDLEVKVEIHEDNSVIAMFEQYVNTYWKDHPKKNEILQLGKERYLKKVGENATL